MKSDYSFLFHHVDFANCGQHDLYNGFLICDSVVDGLADWQEENPGAVPIGVCLENKHCTGTEPMDQYVAMVYEDANGNRYFVHIPQFWIEEAKVADKGPVAMEDAKWLYLYGVKKSDMKHAEATR